jgi:hypothetical protein
MITGLERSKEWLDELETKGAANDVLIAAWF